MKTVKTIRLFALLALSSIASLIPQLSSVSAQQTDSMYVYTAGAVVFKKAVSTIDSVTFYKAPASTGITLIEDFQQLPAAAPTGDVGWTYDLSTGSWMLSGYKGTTLTADAQDAGFTTGGRKYIYSSGMGGTLKPFTTNSGKFKGVKSVRITTAGSLRDFAINNYGSDVSGPMTAFDPTKSGYSLTLRCAVGGSLPQNAISPSVRYKNQGVWNTVTFTIPDKATLTGTYGFSSSDADTFLANPMFDIYSRDMDISILIEQLRGGGQVTPVIYQQVEFNY